MFEWDSPRAWQVAWPVAWETVITDVHTSRRCSLFFGFHHPNLKLWEIAPHRDECFLIKRIAPCLLSGDDLAKRCWLSLWTYAFAGAFTAEDLKTLSETTAAKTSARAQQLTAQRERLWLLLISMCDILLDIDVEEWDPAVKAVWRHTALPEGRALQHVESAGLPLMTHALVVGNVAAVKALQALAGEEVVGPTPELVLECAQDAHEDEHSLIARELLHLS